VAAAIGKFKCVTKTIPQDDGDPIKQTTIEIEMHDKKGALDLQARMAGMLWDNKVADNFRHMLNMYFGAQPQKEISPPVSG
jgi:hypothetical protein